MLGMIDARYSVRNVGVKSGGWCWISKFLKPYRNAILPKKVFATSVLQRPLVSSACCSCELRRDESKRSDLMDCDVGLCICL
jgi:hypothetical protein